MATNDGFIIDSFPGSEPNPDYDAAASIFSKTTSFYDVDQQTAASFSSWPEFHLVKRQHWNDEIHRSNYIYDNTTNTRAKRNGPGPDGRDSQLSKESHGFVSHLPDATSSVYCSEREPRPRLVSVYTTQEQPLTASALTSHAFFTNTHISADRERPRQIVLPHRNYEDHGEDTGNDQTAPSVDNETRQPYDNNVSVMHQYGRQSSRYSQNHFAPANFYCTWICNHPRVAFTSTLGLHIAMVILTAILWFAGYNIAPTSMSQIPLFLRNEDVYLRQMAWTNRDESEVLYGRMPTNTNISERSVRYRSVAVTFIYDAEHGNIFTKENLQIINDFENKLYHDEQYRKYCVLLDSGACEKPYSLMRFFDGTYVNVNQVFDDAEFTNIGAVAYRANTDPLIRREFLFFLGADSEVPAVGDNSGNIAWTSLTRSVFQFGYPLPGFNTTKDPDKVQAKLIEDFIVNTYSEHWKSVSREGLSGLKFAYGNFALQLREINDQVITDMLFIAGSFIFIFIFMWIQTHSLWLTAWGMGSIMLCLVTGNLIYNIIFDFKYLGIFHLLALFILLGIGADDVFIFCDSWKALEDKYYPSLAHRLSAAYRKAAATMLVTSLTTAAAFFTSSFSPILSISSFGTFAGLIVLVNYLSIIIFYPTVVILWHLNWEQRPCCLTPCCTTLFRKSKVQSNATNPITRSFVKAKQHRSSRACVRFLSGPYFQFITNNIVRGILIVACMVLLGTFLYFVTELEPDDEPLRIMKDGNNLQNFRNYMTKRFREGQGSFLTKQYIVWGLKNQDLSNCHLRSFDMDCIGNTVWDNAFDLNPRPAQKALMDFCLKLLNMSEEETELYKIKRNIITNTPEVDCFIIAMDEFLRKEADRLYANISENTSSDGCKPDLDLCLPLTEGKMQTFLQARPDLYHPPHGEIFYRYFEIVLAYWLANGYRIPLNADTRTFQHLIGESLSKWDSTDIINQPGIKYGTQLRYVAISVNLTISLVNTKYTDGLEAYRHWEEFMKYEMSNMPPSLQNGFHTTAFDWHWFHVAETLVRQGVITVAAGLSVGWVLLVLISGNFIVGTMAALTIAGVTACVVGLIDILGWKLGVLEALNMTLVVGLSVDYVVHLGVAYTYAPVPDRKGRVHYALREIGLSVVSGAITTLGSGFFMLFAQIVFFMQFGIFIFATIGFSILFAMTFFLVLLSLVGPQGTTGMTGPIAKKIIHKLKGRDDDDEKCSQCYGQGYVKHAINNISYDVQ